MAVSDSFNITGTFRTGGELPLWTGTSNVSVSERLSLPDPVQTFRGSLAELHSLFFPSELRAAVHVIKR
jgi:hypothetical protein